MYTNGYSKLEFVDYSKSNYLVKLADIDID